MNFRKVSIVAVVISLAITVLSQGNRAATEVTIKGKKISIDYG